MFGKLWENACFDVWYTNSRQMSTVEKVWTVMMIIILIASANFCVVLGIKKWIKGRKEAQEERDRMDTIEDAREM